MNGLEELLARDGKLVYKTRGRSMEPMLRQNRDLVIVQVPASRLKKNDVALYKHRESYVLHRVIEVKDDHYRIRGDNTYTLETVPDSAVLGVLTGFVRKGREHAVTDKGYRRYVRFWNAVYPVRRFRFRARRRLIALARKLGLIPVLKRMLRHE